MEKKNKDIRLSPTSVITWHRCPKEFYYSYVLRLPTPTNIHLIKGNVVHKVLEWFFSRKFRPDFEVFIEELFETAWLEKKEELQTLNLNDEDYQRERLDCLNMLNLYIHSFRMKIDLLLHIGKVKGLRHGFYTLRPKTREMWIENKDLNFCGYIDRVHKDFDGKLTIGDYKTSARYGIGIKDEYELQCGLYALLYKLKTKILADKVSVIYLRYGEEIIERATPDLIKMSLMKLMQVKDNIKTRDIEDYPKKECNFCKWCNHFERCSGVKEVEGDIRKKKAIEEVLGKKDEVKQEKTD